VRHHKLPHGLIGKLLRRLWIVVTG
jgi:hypothetical protein